MMHRILIEIILSTKYCYYYMIIRILASEKLINFIRK